MYCFGCIDGDMRMKYLCKALKADGYSATLLQSAKQASGYDVIILPVGMSGKGISAKYIFGSVKEENVTSYTSDEYFKARNALPTAEGAIEIAMQNTDFTISGSTALVLGYGFCGKALVSKLRCLDADVTVAARKASDRALAENCGAKAITFEYLKGVKTDIIFNTVPAPILTEKILETISRDTLIIDIASKPGGIDFDAAEKFGIKTVHALGIPGKFAPFTAGIILKNTVLAMLNEEGGSLWNKN